MGICYDLEIYLLKGIPDTLQHIVMVPGCRTQDFEFSLALFFHNLCFMT